MSAQGVSAQVVCRRLFEGGLRKAIDDDLYQDLLVISGASRRVHMVFARGKTLTVNSYMRIERAG